MIRTLIVDDDALVRATLRALLRWEDYGYLVVQDCTSGMQALDYLRLHNVDLVITDMKMPGMSGIELLRQLRKSASVPVSVVLSGYDEFDLVREAFRLGAYDYLLKDKLEQASLARLLTDLRQKIFIDRVERESAAPDSPGTLGEGDHVVAAMMIQDYPSVAERFGGELTERLQRPMLELARQIPRLNGRGQLRAVTPAHYELYYQVTDKTRIQNTIVSVVRQIQQVWRDYMNLQVVAGISMPVKAAEVPAASARCARSSSTCAVSSPMRAARTLRSSRRKASGSVPNTPGSSRNSTR